MHVHIIHFLCWITAATKMMAAYSYERTYTSTNRSTHTSTHTTMQNLREEHLEGVCVCLGVYMEWALVIVCSSCSGNGSDIQVYVKV